MKSNNQIDQLEQKIALLKNKQKYDLELLKTHFHYAYEGLKPVNIIKKTLSNVISSSEIKANLLKGMANYLLNKIFPEKKNSTFTKIIGFGMDFLRTKNKSNNGK
jgi:hypothetical protein